tara:strand:- start:1005 stop:1277 length:273 start_codon:yes stop_codon:yes gene_type:complete
MLQFINPKTFSIAKQQFSADEFIIFTHPNMSELSAQSDRDINTFNKYIAGKDVSMLGEYTEHDHNGDAHLVSAYGISAKRIYANGETQEV